MKRHLYATLFGAALVSGLAFSQGPDKQRPLEERVQALEAALAEQKAATAKLAADLAATRELAERTVRYLDAQANAAAAMAGTLDASEEAGFTYGINPDSRHVLLAGWREQLASAQTDVPTAAPAKASEKAPAKAPEKPAERPPERP
jgi:uncharacterized coiled-coil protein SlyX